MITYEYFCPDCEHGFETEQSIKDKPINICPECNSDAIHRVIHATTVFVDQGPKTLGQLADRNTKKMGTYELQEKRNFQKVSEKLARKAASEEAGRKMGFKPIEKTDNGLDASTVNKITKMSPDQVKKYIREGD